MNSQQLINEAKERFKLLENKGFDWLSFFNGYLAGNSKAIKLHKKLEDKYEAVNDLETELKEKIAEYAEIKKCSDCGGSGTIDQGGYLEDCYKCGGNGFVIPE